MYRASNTSIAAQYEENMALCRRTNHSDDYDNEKGPGYEPGPCFDVIRKLEAYLQ
jgi:hypothetical protein